MKNYNPPEHSLTLPDETIQKWKEYLAEYDRLKKIEDHNTMIARLSLDPNYEKYRAEVLTDGRKDTDFGFEMLYSLVKHLEETPKEKIEKYFKEVNDMGIEGPTVDEYFEGLNPHAQYQKGYTACARKLKEEITNKLRNDLDEHGLSKHYSVDDFIALMEKTLYEE